MKRYHHTKSFNAYVESHTVNQALRIIIEAKSFANMHLIRHKVQMCMSKVFVHSPTTTTIVKIINMNIVINIMNNITKTNTIAISITILSLLLQKEKEKEGMTSPLEAYQTERRSVSI